MWVLGTEIALFVMGLVALVTGKFPAGKGRTVHGAPARALGFICLLPMPTAFFAGLVLGGWLVFQNIQMPKETLQAIGAAIEIGVLIFYGVLISVLGRRMSAEQEASPATAKGPAPDLEAEPAGSAGGRKREPGAEGVPDWWHEADAPRSPKAKASVLFGALSLVLTVFASIPAFVLGALALREIRLSQGRLTGKGSAIAGIVLGFVGMFTGCVTFAILIPMLKTMADPLAVPAPPPVAFAPAPVNVAAPAPAPVNVAANVPAPGVAAPRRAPNIPGQGAAKPGLVEVKAGKGRFFRERPLEPSAEVPAPAQPIADARTLVVNSLKVKDVGVTDLKVDAKEVLPCVAWGGGGKAFFVLEGRSGLLRRVALDGFREELRWEIKQPCQWLSPSAEGLLVTVGEREVWTLDPSTFAVKARVVVPEVRRVVSSPSLSVAYAVGHPADSVGVVDLKAARVVREYKGQNAGFDRPVVSPDGKYLFADGSEMLIRFAVKGDTLAFEEASRRVAQNGRRIEVSPDSSLVAYPSGGGNYGAGNYTTYVFKASDFAVPELKIASGAYPQALGFDPKAGAIYAQNHDESLIVFGMGGEKGKSYKFAGVLGRGDSPKQFAVHPDGGKLLAVTDSSLWFVDLSGKTAFRGAGETPDEGKAVGSAARKARKAAPKPKAKRP